MNLSRIAGCRCDRQTGDTYYIKCRIPDRGTHLYTYRDGDCFIRKVYSDREFNLSERALRRIKRATGIFGFMTLIPELSYDVESFGFEDGSETTVYYKRHPVINRFTYIIDRNSNGENNDVTLFRNSSADSFLEDIDRLYRSSSAEARSITFNNRTIMNHPLYDSAAFFGDAALMRLIKKFYGIGKAEPGTKVRETRRSKPRVLPKLPEQYDRDYVVDSDTVNVKMLTRSGYEIKHCPYFHMNGRTHDKWRLNPHRQTGTDAARSDAESIAFIDFLGLFD